MARERIFSRSELAALREDARKGRRLRCPRCGVELVPHPVARPEEVSYVRRRTWHLCPSCRRSAVLDRRRSEPMKDRSPEPRTLPLVGWREWVALPELGIERVKAKVDTGARSSALHAFDVEEVEGPEGAHIRFTVLPLQGRADPSHRVEAPLVDRRSVRSSTGEAAVRPVVRIQVQVGETRWPVEVTLARRDHMGFRMLLGRTAIRHRFLVDPGRSFLQGNLPAEEPSTEENPT
ncbi:MAG: ATP-dependent zinc protease [bacterium]